MAQDDPRNRQEDPSVDIEELERENRQLRENLTVLEQMRSRLGTLAETLVRINHVTQELNTLDIDRIIRVATHQVPQIISARYCSLYLYDYSRNELILRSHNHPAQIAERIKVGPEADSIMAFALRQKRILHIPDIDAFEEIEGVRLVRPHRDKYATQSCICAPLMTGNYTVGVLNFADKIGEDSFDQINDVSVVEQISQVIAMALRNCRLFREIQTQARTDGLTKLANYRSFYEQLRAEMHRATRYKRQLTLLMFDVDHFKGINDTYGHQAGDMVLKEVGGMILDSLRREDLAARYGGDEIAVILPETPAAGAMVVAQRLLEMARGKKFASDNKSFGITLSIGLAAFQPEMTITQFVEAADRGLYQAKQKGRDRIETIAGNAG